MPTTTIITGEQQDDTTCGATENETPNTNKLLPWSDIQITETANGLTPEYEQQRRIQRLQEIINREKFAVQPSKIDATKQLCERCQSVPWDQLATCQLPGPAGVRIMYEINETREELLTSQCLVCTFLGNIWPEGVRLERRFLGVRCLCNMLPGQATSQHHSPGYDHSPQFQLSGFVETTQKWSSENFGVLHPWSAYDELAPRHVDDNHINVKLINEWLETCNKLHQHELAGPRGKERVPGFKVIDCRTNCVVPVAHEVCRYVALSYVWGDPSLQKEPEPGTYPKTINDAISVCNMLGFEYLWVDKYCINQDDPEEKAVQVNLMDCIYSQAELTIIATDENPTLGLPGVGAPRKTQQCLQINHVELIKTYHCDELILSSKWASRGWTFQEGYLSRRKLIFTKQEVVYLCDDMYCQESVRKDIPLLQTGQRQGLAGEALQGLSPMSTNERKGRVELDDLLNEYNSRELGWPSDILNACQGILRGLSIQHNWGLPILPTSWWDKARQLQESYTMILYWQSDEPQKKREDFPTWSWTGWEGSKIFYNYDRYYADASTIEAKSTTGKWLRLEQCFDQNGSSLATALSQRIRITGLTVPLAQYIVNQAWINHKMPGYQPPHKGPHAVFPYSANVDIVATVHLDQQGADPNILNDAVGLLINRHRRRRYRGIMLVLKPSGDHYRRIGILNFRNVGVFKNQRDFTQSKRLLRDEDDCLWMKDFKDKTIEVE